jgi:hypothetical protein
MRSWLMSRYETHARLVWWLEAARKLDPPGLCAGPTACGSVTASRAVADALARAPSPGLTLCPLLRIQQWATRRGVSTCLSVALLSCAWVSSSTAFAAPADEAARTEARALAYAGVEAYQAADYQTAHDKLEASFRLLPVPSLGLWSARALVAVGKLLEAERRYQEVSRMEVGPADPPVQRSGQIDAARELQQLSPRIPSLSFQFVGAMPDQGGLEVDGVVIDGQERGRPLRLDPGRHEVVSRRGTDKTVVILDLVEGQHEEIALRFADPITPAPQAPVAAAMVVPLQRANTSSPLRTAGWLTLAAGGASVATGVVAYLVSRDEHSEVERLDECSTPSCSAGSPDTYRAYANWRRVNVVGLVSGGLLGAAGVTLLVASHGASDAEEPTESARLGLRLGPTSAELFGCF